MSHPSRSICGSTGGYFLYLREHLRQLDPQVVHLHGHHWSTPEVLFALKRIDRRIPTALNYHIDAYTGTLGRRLFWRVYTKIGRYMANATTHIVAVSDFETDYIHQTFGVSYDKVSVIPRGVDGV
ncbi:MAG: glycosyltransferase family 4 protein [Halobacteriota archaeon]